MWDSFVDKSPYATFLFKRDFMTYHQDRFADASLMVYDQDTLIALVPANKEGSTFFVHQGLSYGSVILASAPDIKDLIGLLKSIFEFLQQAQFDLFYYKTMPEFYLANPLPELDYLFCLMQPSETKSQLYSVCELQQPYGFSRDRKQGIKRGEKYGLTIEESGDFDFFWQVLLEPNLALKHHVKPTHTLEEIKHLKKIFPHNITLFLVKHQHQYVAGTVVFETPTVAHSQYIASDDARSMLGSLDFLHHYLFKIRYAHKAYFDFGISSENKGTLFNYGLWYWKSGFGCRAFHQYFYHIPIKNHHYLDKLIK